MYKSTGLITGLINKIKFCSIKWFYAFRVEPAMENAKFVEFSFRIAV